MGDGRGLPQLEEVLRGRMRTFGIYTLPFKRGVVLDYGVCGSARVCVRTLPVPRRAPTIALSRNSERKLDLDVP